MDGKKLKIYSLATTYPEALTSVKPKFVHVLNKELAQLGVDVKVIVPHTKGSLTTETMESVMIRRFKYLPEKFELNEQSIPDEMKRSKLGRLKVTFMIGIFFIFTYFECVKEKPDIIHGHWAFPGGYIAFLISKLVGSKCVISIHGAETPLLKKSKFILKKTINSLNKSHAVIVNSDYTKNEYKKLGVKEDKMTTINPPPNFVKHTQDKELLKKFRRSFVTDDSKIILFVGRLVERKGVEYLIKAVPKIKTSQVHVIIAGGGWLMNDLKELVSSLELDNKVTFFGPPTNEELGYLHDISDVFVIPSIVDSMGETEGLGLVIPEAMESGLPVIATSVGGIVDVVKNNNNGILINQKDSNAIAEAVDKIFSNKDFADKLIQNSKKTVSNFLPSLIAKKHLEIFQKIKTN